MSQNQKTFFAYFAGLVLSFIFLYVFTVNRLVPARVAEIVPTEIVRILPELLDFSVQQARGTATACPCVVPTPTPTPTAGRGTPSPQAGTPTQTPAVATIPPTNTPTPTVQLTPPVLFCPPHPNVWHAPQDEVCQHHHHGFNPRGNAPNGQSFASIFSIDGFDLNAYLDANGELFQPWLTSPLEDPVGMIWLYIHEPTCIQFANVPGKFEGVDCVTDVLVRIHDPGTSDHFLNRFHSETFIIKGCAKLANDQPNFNDCGILVTGDNHDYGLLEEPYKQKRCFVPGKDPSTVDFGLDQPPYRAQTVSGERPIEDLDKILQFWSGQPPQPKNQQYYPDAPNSLIGFGWSSVDAWQLFDRSICGLPFDEMVAAAKEFPPVPGFDHNEFQIWSFTVQAHPPGPFTGWTKPNGQVWPVGEPEGGCLTASQNCIPLIITANFPDGEVAFAHQVDQGDCSFSPCIVIPTGGVELIFPPYDMP